MCWDSKLITALTGQEKDKDEYKNPGSGEARPQWKLAANIKDTTGETPTRNAALQATGDPSTQPAGGPPAAGIPEPGGQRSEVSG